MPDPTTIAWAGSERKGPDDNVASPFQNCSGESDGDGWVICLAWGNIDRISDHGAPRFHLAEDWHLAHFFGDAFTYTGIAAPRTDWIGVQQIVNWILDQSAAVVIFVAATLVTMMFVALGIGIEARGRRAYESNNLQG
jgi:hypothetical protein